MVSSEQFYSWQFMVSSEQFYLWQFMQQGCFTDNVSLFNQPDITDEQFFEVDSNLGHMLYFTP